jgi:EAL domain-containing protein (putative c-di-GMP-specific phosphodiesterase class I)
VSAREFVLLIDDDRDIVDALAILLEREGRTTVICSDVESAEIVLARYPITHVVSDVQFSGAFGFEGLHFVTRIRAQNATCRIIMMTGFASDALRTAAIALGATAVLAKPFDLDQLEAVIGSSNTTDTNDYEIVRVPPIDDVLHGNILSAVFQPIVQFDGNCAVPYGYEALTRIRGTWPGGGAAELFEYASRRERLADLNLAALACAMGEASQLPARGSLFMNVDPLVFAGGEVAATLRTAASRTGFPLSRIVLEITERSGFGEGNVVPGLFEELRDEGVRFALDDHGSAYSHLGMIHIIRPSFIKISQTFGTAFEEDPTRIRIVRHVVALARDFGCRTVLEGIECAETARAAATFGVDLLQGYHFGRPAAASTWNEATQVAA